MLGDIVHLNCLSASTTWTPFSKSACPFWPAEAKWPLIDIFSGAVLARLIAMGLLLEVKERSGDCGGERVEFAMTMKG
jgi:hypothetical protein